MLHRWWDNILRYLLFSFLSAFLFSSPSSPIQVGWAFCASLSQRRNISVKMWQRRYMTDTEGTCTSLWILCSENDLEDLQRWVKERGFRVEDLGYRNSKGQPSRLKINAPLDPGKRRKVSREEGGKKGRRGNRRIRKQRQTLEPRKEWLGRVPREKGRA